MNVIWRTLLRFALSYRRLRKGGRMHPLSVSRVRATCLPTDIDIVGHMNNGRYLSLFDLGRFDLLVRGGMWQAMKSNGWYPVVATASVSFRKSLRMWQRFVIETRVMAADDKAVYMEHRAVVRGEIYASIVIRSRIVRKSGGVVPTEELLAAFGVERSLLSEPQQWIKDWSAVAPLPSTRVPAPSVWEDIEGARS